MTGMNDSIDPITPAGERPARFGLFGRCLRTSMTGRVGFGLVMFVVIVAIFGPLLTPYAPKDQSAMYAVGANARPSAEHWLGTDRLGYDILTQLLYGARTALVVGLGAVLISGCAGILIGGIAGYRGGWTDEVLMRFAEFFLVVPIFIIILAVVRVLSKAVTGTAFETMPYFNLTVIILMIGLFGWAPIARMTRGEFLRIKTLEFVQAARCGGQSGRQIVLSEILPNAFPSIVVLIALEIGGAILAEAMISLLGFGDPNAVSWGQMLYFNYQSLKIWPMASLAPGFMIFITVLGFNLLADGLSDAANPRARRR
ncbi:ABC transporter permease [Sinirhodobacter populi]|uniref:ABC transporter permease n=2 Tax=Paenirhodobacter populi TaxID=2306993 RepID=A0A443K2Z5_9RHOB|nr:ABC transporter permease [Sinirhodobacter populi]